MKPKQLFAESDVYNARFQGAINIPLLESLQDQFTEISDRDLQSIYLKLATGDNELRSQLSKRINAVSGLTYGFEDDESGELWVAFNEMIDVNGLMTAMLSAILYGYSAIQLIWEKQGSTSFLKEFKLRPNYLFNRTIDDKLTIYRGTSLDNEGLDPNQWLIHKHNYGESIPYLNGVMRGLARDLVYKNISIRDADRYQAIFGIPLVIGHYPIGSDETNIDLFNKFLRDLTSNATGALPEGFQVEIVQPPMTNIENSPFNSTIRYTDNQINLAINGGTLTSVNSNVGSRALGEVLDKGRLELINDDALQVVRTINKQLLPLMFNKSLGLKTPKMIIVTETEQAGVTDNAGSEDDMSNN